MGNLNQRVNLFNQVRDIPYYIAIKGEQDYSCLTKCNMLALLLATEGVKTRPVLCEFLWKDVGLPPSILKLPNEDPATHVFLEMQIPETKQWIQIDPTWDARIKHKKISIAAWDGKSSTSLAVVPLRLLNQKESLSYLSSCKKTDVKSCMSEYGIFYRALNRWIGLQRS